MYVCIHVLICLAMAIKFRVVYSMLNMFNVYVNERLYTDEYLFFFSDAESATKKKRKKKLTTI